MLVYCSQHNSHLTGLLYKTVTVTDVYSLGEIGYGEGNRVNDEYEMSLKGRSGNFRV